MRSSAALPVLLATICSIPASAFEDNAPNTAPTALRPRGEIPYAATTAAPMIGGRDAARKWRRQATGDQTCGWFQGSEALPWTCEENHECTTNAQKVVACVPAGTPSPASSDFYSECRDYSQAQWKSCTSLPDGIGCCTATDLPACGLVVWKEDPGRSMWRCYDRPTTITLAETPPPGAVLSTAAPTTTTEAATTGTAASSATTGTETAGLANAAPDTGSDDDDDESADSDLSGDAGGGGQSGSRHAANIGAIVGGAVGGGVAFLLVMAGVVFFLVRRRKHKKEAAETVAAAASADPDSREPKGRDDALVADPHASGGVRAPQGRPSVASFGPLENLPYPTVSLVPPSATTLVPGSPTKHDDDDAAAAAAIAAAAAAAAAVAYSTAGTASYHSGVSELSLADQKQLHEMPHPIILDDSSSEEAAFDAEHGAYVRQSMYSPCISPSNEILDLEGGTPGASNDLGGLAERVAIRY